MTVAPFTTTYAARTPYLTVAEFLASPTAIALNDLLPNGTLAQQTDALTQKIAQASSWMDDLCQQVLAATVDTDRGRYRVNRDGYVRVPLRYKPILEVRSVSVGLHPSNLTALSDYSNVAIFRSTVEVPVLGTNLATAPTNWPSGGLGVGSKALVDVTYVNGFANTLTGVGGATKGATSLPVTGALGIYPGSTVTVYDGSSSEQIVVAPSYTAGALSLPLTSPLLFDHAAGVSVSNLPPRAKEAAVLLTSALIQTRGDDALILDAMETPSRMSGQSGASAEDIALAMDMLENLTRVW